MKTQYFNLQPLTDSFDHLVRVQDYKKKKLTDNDVWTLRYVAMRFISKNFGYFFSDNSWKEIDDRNAVCDDELYLNDFEGFEVDDRYTVRTLFLTEDGAVLTDIYDRKLDKFKAYLVD